MHSQLELDFQNHSRYFLERPAFEEKKSATSPSNEKSGDKITCWSSGMRARASTPCKRNQSTNRSVTMPERYSRDFARNLNSDLRQRKQIMNKNGTNQYSSCPFMMSLPDGFLVFDNFSIFGSEPRHIGFLHCDFLQ